MQAACCKTQATQMICVAQAALWRAGGRDKGKLYLLRRQQPLGARPGAVKPQLSCRMSLPIIPPPAGPAPRPLRSSQTWLARPASVSASFHCPRGSMESEISPPRVVVRASVAGSPTKYYPAGARGLGVQHGAAPGAAARPLQAWQALLRLAEGASAAPLKAPAASSSGMSAGRENALAPAAAPQQPQPWQQLARAAAAAAPPLAAAAGRTRRTARGRGRRTRGRRSSGGATLRRRRRRRGAMMRGTATMRMMRTTLSWSCG